MINKLRENKNPILCANNPITLRCLVYKDKLICIQKAMYNGSKQIEEKLIEYALLKRELNGALVDRVSEILTVKNVIFNIGVDTVTGKLTIIPSDVDLMEGEAYISYRGKLILDIPSSEYTYSEQYFTLISFNQNEDRDKLIKNMLQDLKIDKDLEKELEEYLDKMISIFKREHLINSNKRNNPRD